MLTKSEKQVMDLLWSCGEPLSCVQIVKRSSDKTWKDSYVHLMINSLLEKDMIKIAGFVKMTKNYARTFAPTMTREEYAVKGFSDDGVWTREQVPGLFASLINKETDTELIDKLDKILQEKKRSLKG